MPLHLANNRISDHEGPLFCFVSSLTCLQNSRQLLAHEPAVLPDHFKNWWMSLNSAGHFAAWLIAIPEAHSQDVLEGVSGREVLQSSHSKMACHQRIMRQSGRTVSAWASSCHDCCKGRITQRIVESNSEMAKSKEMRQDTWICYQFWEGTRVPWPTLLQVTKVI